ncbi:MAG: hypothetical protein U9N56_05875 [Actinomycetota bacterium]|nr:hypothetical protein [Actinomycetota bacterium]
MTPELALAASAREWPDRLHRHILDHGGGKVVTRVMLPDQAFDSAYDVLLIDDVCSFLSPGLIAKVKRSGAEVVGVFSPVDGSHAKRRLLECGISDVIETEASPEEFLSTARSAIGHRGPVVEPAHVPTAPCWSIGILGVTDGVGATEIAIGVAQGLANQLPTVLIDADSRWPSVAQRLDLPVHPNIRTALDAAVHGSGDVRSSLHETGDLRVMGGIADLRSPSPLSHSELSMLIDSLGGMTSALVVDLGSQHSVPGGILSTFDSVAVVGSGDPVGLSRLIVAVEQIEARWNNLPLLLVVNRASTRRFHKAEIRTELQTSFPGHPFVVVPEDPRLVADTWEGNAAQRGPFSRATRRMADLVAERVAP